MKNKYMIKLIYSICILGILIYFWIKTPNGKIILIPFILAAISEFGKYLSLFIGNNRLAFVFHKCFILSFLLYWFGFLIYANYRSIINEEYSLLLFSLIFWIVGIVFLIKALKK